MTESQSLLSRLFRKVKVVNKPPKANPAIYPKMREHALLKIRLKNLSGDSVHSVLMDWNVTNGTATVLAAADGTASLYLSSGGGFLGGGQKYPEIRNAALHAVQLAADFFPHFKTTETIDLPAAGDVFFYLTTSNGVRMAVAKEANLRAGIDPLASLGATMQEIITQYRLKSPHPSSAD
jgi:hypothetical protein